MPFTVLCAIVLVLCIVGGYAPAQRMHDVWLIVVFGFGAFALRKADYPMAPLVLALVLGPLMEKSFRQALISSQGDVMTFVDRPISATLVVISVALFAAPFVRTLRRRRAAASPSPAE
jgi:putative tricarboxylic transport membrane protein